jgi:hypothetical protein
MTGRWPQASIADQVRTAPLAQRVFDSKLWRASGRRAWC